MEEWLKKAAEETEQKFKELKEMIDKESPKENVYGIEKR